MGMRLATLLAFVLFAGLILAAPPSNAVCRFSCSDHCAQCTHRQLLTDGTQSLTFDLSSCKGSAISWVCCRDSTCSATCNNGTSDGPNKCSETTSVTFNVPATQTTLNLQYHDGILDGNFDCFAGLTSTKGTGNCCGGQGGSCGQISGVCNELIDIAASCPCVSDSDCLPPPAQEVCAQTQCISGVCVKSPKPSSFVCRNSVGPCDAPEVCSGTLTCPTDAKRGSDYVCRLSAGACDVDDRCDGTNNECTSDAKAPSSTVCRLSAGVCDVDDRCDGTNNECTSDAKAPASTVCRASAGDCDTAESCNGVDAACPPNAVTSAGVLCRPSDPHGGCTGDNCCDIGEVCDGVNGACPADGSQPDSCKCARCTNIQTSGAQRVVTIDVSSCKGGRTGTVSWVCGITGVTGTPSSSSCPPGAHDLGFSCSEVLTARYIVASGAQSITLQYHDGVLVGNTDCDVVDCCGGSGTSCDNTPYGVCTQTIDLSTCPT